MFLIPSMFHLPTPLLILAVVLIIVAVFGAILKAKFAGTAQTSDDGKVYELCDALFSPAERTFLLVLENSLPDGVGILAKVRLGDIFTPHRSLSASLRLRALNKINQKHVDYLLVRTSDLTPVAGIELDDKSHRRADRVQRDVFVDEVFRTCKLPLLRIPVTANYGQIHLRNQIAALLPAA